MKKVIVITMVGGIILINTSVFSYDLGKSSGICKNSGNTETTTYLEEEALKKVATL